MLAGWKSGFKPDKDLVQPSIQDQFVFQYRLAQLEDMEKEVESTKVELLAGNVLQKKQIGRPKKHPVAQNILQQSELIKKSVPVPKKPSVKRKIKRKINIPKKKRKRVKLRNEKPVKEPPLFMFGFKKKS